MLSSFFNKNKYSVLVSVLGFYILSFLTSLFLSYTSNYNSNTLLLQIGNFGIGLLLFFLYLFIVRKNYLTKNNFYALFIFALFILNFFEVYAENYFLLSCLFLSLGLRKVFSLKSPSNVKQKLFDSGFWIGLSGFFFFWNILFMPLIFLALFFFKKQSFRNIIIPFVGFLASSFLGFTYRFFFNKELFFIVSPEFSLSYFYSYKIIFTGVFLFFTFLGILIFSAKILSIKNHFQSYWKLLVTQLFLSLLIVILAKDKHIASFLLIFPSMCIISLFLERVSKVWIKEASLIILVLVAIVFGFFIH